MAHLMKAKLLREMQAGPTCPDELQRDGWVPSGTVLENPQAYLLVRMGVAEPADEECEAAAEMTPTALQAAQQAYERLSRGIHPDDFEAFNRGEMDGYDEEGKPVKRDG